MGALRERLGQLGLLRPGAEGDARLEEGAPHLALLRLCEAGQLEGGLSVALDVRPDELIGPLCVAVGGRARELKVADVRERPALELTIHFDGRDERWELEGLVALVHNLNDLLRADPHARAIAVLGEWEDALQLWCVKKQLLPRLFRERFFAPRNGEALRHIC